jgi:hypothetical protein
MQFRLASVAFTAVLAAYLFLGAMGDTRFGNPATRDEAYNLLARGILKGQLSLDKAAPASLARLADPYDPAANGAARDPRDRLNDLSYFRGKLYLYFGVAPALLVFIPWHLLTGGWLQHWAAAVLLCTGGLLVNLSLVQAAKRAVLGDSRPWLMAACTLLLGFASYAPLLLARADMWEVPIAFSYLGVSVALRCLWEAHARPGWSTPWLAAASAAIGLSFAARPTVLPNALILLAPFLNRENRRDIGAWAAAILPAAAVGVGVAVYNAARFTGPFDFGVTYQLAGVYVARLHTFSPSYLATNLGFYLFQGVAWVPYFPFVHQADLGPLLAHLPANHGGVQQISGALLNAPVLWFAAAAPLVLRAGSGDRRLILTAASAGWVAFSSLLLLSSFYGACSRYQFEFVPEIALLAALGLISVEALADARLRTAVRALLAVALALSCAFPFLYGIDRCATDHNTSGITYLAYGDIPGAAREFDDAQFLAPGNPVTRLGTSMMLGAEGRRRESEAGLRALVSDHPDYPTARLALGSLLSQEGRRDEAFAVLDEARRRFPDDAGIRVALSTLQGPRK